VGVLLACTLVLMASRGIAEGTKAAEAAHPARHEGSADRGLLGVLAHRLFLVSL
jgi:hypothetical protein